VVALWVNKAKRGTVFIQSQTSHYHSNPFCDNHIAPQKPKLPHKNAPYQYRQRRRPYAQHNSTTREKWRGDSRERRPTTAVCRSVFPVSKSDHHTTEHRWYSPRSQSDRNPWLAGWLPVAVPGRQSVRAGLKSSASLRGFCPSLSLSLGGLPPCRMRAVSLSSERHVECDARWEWHVADLQFHSNSSCFRPGCLIVYSVLPYITILGRYLRRCTKRKV